MAQIAGLVIYACTLLNLCIGFVYKVPQIVLLYRNQSTQGLSYITTIGDVVSNSVYILYSVYFSYEFISYADYILYLLQSTIIVVQMHCYDRKYLSCFMTAVLLIAMFHECFKRPVVMSNCIYLCTFSSIFGKLLQIEKIIRAESVKSVSIAYWCLSWTSSASKLVQVSLAETIDKNLISHCTLSVVTTSILVILLYRRQCSDKLKQN